MPPGRMLRPGRRRTARDLIVIADGLFLIYGAVGELPQNLQGRRTRKRGYVYVAMGFAVLVEAMNMRLRKVRQAAVSLRNPFAAAADRDRQAPA